MGQRKGYKQSEAHKINIGDAHRGKKKNYPVWNKGKSGLQVAWNKGKEMSDVAKKKLSDARKKIVGWKHSLETRGTMSLAQRRERHWNWQGGITEIKLQIRKSFKYRQWRSDVFMRDNYTCGLCGQRGVKLEADHYPKMFSEVLKEYGVNSLESADACEELWNLNNGRTLCENCHKKSGRTRNNKNNL